MSIFKWKVLEKLIQDQNQLSIICTKIDVQDKQIQ